MSGDALSPKRWALPRGTLDTDHKVGECGMKAMAAKEIDFLGESWCNRS
jgi:hypothetical protein